MVINLLLIHQKFIPKKIFQNLLLELLFLIDQFFCEWLLNDFWLGVSFINMDLWELGMYMPIIFVLPMQLVELSLFLSFTQGEHVVSSKSRVLLQNICSSCPLSKLLEVWQSFMDFENFHCIHNPDSFDALCIIWAEKHTK